MHLLFLSSLLPGARAETGFEIANRAILDGLRANGARLTLAGFRRSGQAAPAEPHVDLGERDIENAGAGPLRKARWVAGALASRRPVAVAKLRAFSDDELRRRLAAAGPVDGIVLSSALMPIAYPGLLRDHGPAVLVAHNVEHASAAENAANAAHPLLAALFRREAALLRRGEARVCAGAAAIHTLSREDARGLGLETDPRCATLPLTVGRGRAGAGEGGERRFDVVLIGSWTWAPNRVGMDWFLREVAPLLPADLRIAIAGRFDGAPPPAPRNVEFLGRVDDAQAFLRAGRVVALATRGGTGIQLKTLETLEEGLPAVATPAALRGVEAALPGNVEIAEDPARFAQALAVLVRRERAGEPLRLDGTAFAARQRAALRDALERGLAQAFSGRTRASAAPAPASGGELEPEPERSMPIAGMAV